ncbi:MAG: hypothetical protein RIQ60_957 [Pseudomonadota bacterium]|jgi:hypothetical protein
MKRRPLLSFVIIALVVLNISGVIYLRYLWQNPPPPPMRSAQPTPVERSAKHPHPPPHRRVSAGTP